ncbi:unnamed protein product (mitochondrion) [Plasmodiophora brassicae]|uniref:P-type sodium-transporting ATPase4 n=1 Tax=Plasmodiophora brassicae TaxID=37360 RepID=A0A0G4J0Y9_PLABS|nr:hypothetical protein PBRA_008293 [Plasmodiophora brassicae]SPQ95306.1 unnamed protein product [Plasmodiophora brassicae]
MLPTVDEEADGGRHLTTPEASLATEMQVAPGVLEQQPPSRAESFVTADQVVLFRTLSTSHSLDIRHKVDVRVEKVAADAAAIRSIRWHTMPPDQVLAELKSDRHRGLSSAAVKADARVNRVTPAKSNMLAKVLSYVFGGFNALMWIALVIAVVSYEPLGGASPETFTLGLAFVLAFVIILSSMFYAYVDYNASQVMKAITTLAAQTAVVTRDGSIETVDADDVKVGDMVHLELGVRVPADLVLLDVSSDLTFDRSLLTGESKPVPGSITMTHENPLETRNLALSSTFVVQGTGVGVVFATGDDAVIGRIFHMSTKQVEEPTLLQKEINRFTIYVSTAAVLMFSSALAVWGLWTRHAHPGFANLNQALTNAMGCLTSLVPQGLPVCVALALTIIARIMAARFVIVKNLSIVETSGAMTVICSDKTGTLTAGQMLADAVGFVDHEYADVRRVETRHDPAAEDLFRIAYLCNDSKVGDGDADNGQHVRGNPTDVALMRMAKGMESALRQYTRVYTVAFNSKSKWMLTVARDEESDALHLFIKGAPDVLVKRCGRAMMQNGTDVDLDAAGRDRLCQLQHAWSRRGARVLMLCRKDLQERHLETSDTEFMSAFIERTLWNLTVVGLVAICDPPRDDVPAAVATMRTAGVRVFMVTGDFQLTAEAIARQVGIVTADRVDRLGDARADREAYKRVSQLAGHDMKPAPQTAPQQRRAIVLTGDDVADLDSSDWDVIVTVYEEIVFARTTPEQKLVIVQQIRQCGDNIVGVTGDGVNDAPALKTADIGMAMGAGSDVAKEAAQVILLNNDFASIPVAIENGRLVFENLRKVALYILPAGAYTEMMAVATNVYFGMQLPLTPYQQVVFCILQDVTMSISLMYEKPESDLMSQPPRNTRTTHLVDWRFGVQVVLFIGVFIWVSCFGMFFLYWHWQGFGFYDLMFVFGAWKDGYKGFSLAELDSKLAVSQSIFYVTMTIMQIGNILSTRNRRMSTIHSNPLWGPRRNPVLIVCILVSLSVALLNVYVSTSPGNPNIFRFGYVPGIFWLLPVPLAIALLLADELRKFIVRNCPTSWVANVAW